MKQRFVTLLILLIFQLSFLHCNAQSAAASDDIQPITDWDEVYSKGEYVGLGLMGSIKHPGAEFNFSFPHQFIIREKNKRGGQLRINKARRWDIFARYYYHRNFHHNIMVSIGRSWQRSLKKNNFFISQLDAGVARTFYTNPTFQVRNGVVERVKFGGDFYASINYRIGLGKHIHKKNDVYRWYAYIGAMNFVPYNNLLYTRPVLGVSVNKFMKKEK